jgi:DNA modification methylase
MQVAKLVTEFIDVLQLGTWQPPASLIDAAQQAMDGCRLWRLRDAERRNSELYALVNSKLGLNKPHLREFLSAAAALRVVLNYHEKNEIQECFDRSDTTRLRDLLGARGHDRRLIEAFKPISRTDTLAALHRQLTTGEVRRKDARRCDVAERRSQILQALFGSFVFRCYEPEAMHRHFNQDCRTRYFEDFYSHLLAFHSDSLRRDCALVFLKVDENVRRGLSASELRDALFSFTSSAYERLANHCFFAVLIEPFAADGESGHWCLFADLVLFAEKHRERQPAEGYFRPAEIERQTLAHIRRLEPHAARFDTVHEGFVFRDCFVIAPSDGNDRITSTTAPTKLLLLFEKNEQDETLIPCPACRSQLVAGNSYPTLGVRSWECQNPICAERSAFDRGNRYSLSALIKQQAIKSEEDQIPDSSLRKWKLDALVDADEAAIVRMLLMHFSLPRDTVVLVNASTMGTAELGRNVNCEAFTPTITTGLSATFRQSSYFNRYLVERPDEPAVDLEAVAVATTVSTVCLYNGDCVNVLRSLEPDSVDAAVTSPPYYNARTYAEWPNIYAYLYDMYHAARQVFRVLKPGGVYLFNVFDYFDNENNIALSAMGQKRMILGAYMIDVFRRVGFELASNVVWYKGEIEGKRAFNQGNRSPYYQFPLNCWEHVLVFGKPSQERTRWTFPTILNEKPVVKMIGGKNVHGHSAPFPDAIPEMLVSQMQPGQIVLDPFAGSLTTARVATARGIKAIAIELHREYCDLGARLLARDQAQLDLFETPGISAN